MHEINESTQPDRRRHCISVGFYADSVTRCFVLSLLHNDAITHTRADNNNIPWCTIYRNQQRTKGLLLKRNALEVGPVPCSRTVVGLVGRIPSPFLLKTGSSFMLTWCTGMQPSATLNIVVT